MRQSLVHRNQSAGATRKNELTTNNQKGNQTMKTILSRLRMSSLITPGLAGLAALLIGGCSSMTTNPTPNAPPSATVRIQEWTAAYYGSAAVGKGTLDYKGQHHHFSISGVGAGGDGAQKVSATGKVYDLHNLHDFAGTYHGVSSGLTLIEGKMHAKLVNDSGVVMYLSGITEGLASSSGVQAFEVTLTH
jgi:hypothetical protein